MLPAGPSGTRCCVLVPAQALCSPPPPVSMPVACRGRFEWFDMICGPELACLASAGGLRAEGHAREGRVEGQGRASERQRRQLGEGKDGLGSAEGWFRGQRGQRKLCGRANWGVQDARRWWPVARAPRRAGRVGKHGCGGRRGRPHSSAAGCGITKGRGAGQRPKWKCSLGTLAGRDHTCGHGLIDATPPSTPPSARGRGVAARGAGGQGAGARRPPRRGAHGCIMQVAAAAGVHARRGAHTRLRAADIATPCACAP